MFVSEDWNPTSKEVIRDQRLAYDYMRENCPVAYSEYLQWSVFRHKDIMQILHDPKTFSNKVSKYLSVPNGMDIPAHAPYRKLIEPYLSKETTDAFEPRCRKIIQSLLEEKIETDKVEVMETFALPFAAQVQCAFLGWPLSMSKTLACWTKEKQKATLLQEKERLSTIAEEFKLLVSETLYIRRNTDKKKDITTSLMNENVFGKPIDSKAVISILRNWTVGEIGSIAASIGIIMEFLSRNISLQNRLRKYPEVLPYAIDEILRIFGPLIHSRRMTTCSVEIGGRKIPAGEKISLMWIAANRDGRVFKEPYQFMWNRDLSKSLLYGAGIHVCPGAYLARMELRIVMEEVFKYFSNFTLSQDQSSINAVYPASGFEKLYINLQQ